MNSVSLKGGDWVKIKERPEGHGGPWPYWDDGRDPRGASIDFAARPGRVIRPEDEEGDIYIQFDDVHVYIAAECVEPVETAYIAGPMRGMANFNYDAFDEAASVLRSEPHCFRVLSPPELDREAMGFEGYYPSDDTSLSDEEYEVCLNRALKAVAQADLVALLPGWEYSKGVARELEVARKKGIRVMELNIDGDLVLLTEGRKRFKVGDRVELIKEYFGSPVGSVYEVCSVSAGGDAWVSTPDNPMGYKELCLGKRGTWAVTARDAGADSICCEGNVPCGGCDAAEGQLEPPEDILEEALRITSGDRQAAYGPPDQDFMRTAGMWSSYLGLDTPLKPMDVACMMIMLKLSRQKHQQKRDNWVDVAGYARCGDVCDAEEAKRRDVKRQQLLFPVRSQGDAKPEGGVA